MRILKNGTPKNTKMDTVKFTCTECGCEFECDKGEYYNNFDTVFVTYPEQTRCAASCPECYKICLSWKDKYTVYNTDVNS